MFSRATLLAVFVITCFASPTFAQPITKTLRFAGDTLEFTAPGFPDRQFKKTIQGFYVERSFDSPGASYLKRQGPRLKVWADLHNLDSWNRFLLADSVVKTLAPDIPQVNHELAVYLILGRMDEPVVVVGDLDHRWKLGIKTHTDSDDRAYLVSRRDTVILPYHRSFSLASQPHVRIDSCPMKAPADLSCRLAPRSSHPETRFRVINWFDGGHQYQDTLLYDPEFVGLAALRLKLPFDQAIGPASSPTFINSAAIIVERIRKRHPDDSLFVRALLSFARQSGAYVRDRGSFRGDDCFPPELFVSRGKGDCDDFSLFFGFLLELAGQDFIYLLFEEHASVAVNFPHACENATHFPFQGRCYLISDPTEPTDSQPIGKPDSRMTEKPILLAPQ